ncbi:hypothetical protein QFC20_001905 [Naganishia adeliensis]|uniref:Uncharacterized protein n=1 Tax=Naganishia adeliensis TaxID=92952 RepID=A0ACC2WQR1_9TREE|nr:hypothetical protein QFC20_001905 [Naganishia adeliensis]
MAALVLPTNYTYVALTAVGTLWLNLFQVVVVSKARAAAGLAYPIYMADNSVAEKDPKAYMFNCCQRTHANTLETAPTFLFALLYSGLYYPRAAAVLGALWIAGRFLYTFGYAITGEPEKRNTSGGIFLHIIGLMLLSTVIAGSKAADLLV